MQNCITLTREQSTVWGFSSSELYKTTNDSTHILQWEMQQKGLCFLGYIRTYVSACTVHVQVCIPCCVHVTSVPCTEYGTMCLLYVPSLHQCVWMHYGKYCETRLQRWGNANVSLVLSSLFQRKEPHVCLATLLYPIPFVVLLPHFPQHQSSLHHMHCITVQQLSRVYPWT